MIKLTKHQKPKTSKGDEMEDLNTIDIRDIVEEGTQWMIENTPCEQQIDHVESEPVGVEDNAFHIVTHSGQRFRIVVEEIK